MKFNHKKNTVNSIFVVALSLFICSYGILAGSTAMADDNIFVKGKFEARVDTIFPIEKGDKCILEVGGSLVFYEGPIDGVATGTTRALVPAPCYEVMDFLNNPPGTFPDVFISTLEFEGTVKGTETTAKIIYKGRTKVGGNIDAIMTFSGGFEGVALVDAIVAVGGSYAGFIELDD